MTSRLPLGAQFRQSFPVDDTLPDQEAAFLDSLTDDSRRILAREAALTAVFASALASAVVRINGPLGLEGQ
jgi:hypothetical protein